MIYGTNLKLIQSLSSFVYISDKHFYMGLMLPVSILVEISDSVFVLFV